MQDLVESSQAVCLGVLGVYGLEKAEPEAELDAWWGLLTAKLGHVAFGPPGNEEQLKILKQSSQLAVGKVELQDP